LEHRAHKGTVEIRQNAAGEPVIFGYFGVFNRDSSDLGFIEQVDSRAFDKTIQEADVRGLGNHDVNWLLGRSKPGTLRLGIDQTGGWYEIDVNVNDPDGIRALEKVRRGDWDGSSFSFQTVRDEWNWQTDPPQRRLLEVALIDVGPVTFPAYPDATAAARSALEPIAKRTGRDVDELVSALKTGEIRSLFSKEAVMPESRATNGTLVWGPEEGFNDLLSDLNEQLGVYGSWRYYACDVTVDMTRALICDGSECEYWVAPLAMNGDEPVLSAQSEWVQVERGWIAEPDDEPLERALALVREQRAGKVLSEANVALLKTAMKALRDLMKTALNEEPADSEVAEGEANSVALDREMRMRELAIRGDELAAA
jgi:uncharacterized protein